MIRLVLMVLFVAGAHAAEIPALYAGALTRVDAFCRARGVRPRPDRAFAPEHRFAAAVSRDLRRAGRRDPLIASMGALFVDRRCLVRLDDALDCVALEPATAPIFYAAFYAPDDPRVARLLALPSGATLPTGLYDHRRELLLLKQVDLTPEIRAAVVGHELLHLVNAQSGRTPPDQSRDAYLDEEVECHAIESAMLDHMTKGRYWRALDRVLARVRDCLKRGGHRLDAVYLDRLGFAHEDLDRVFDRPRSSVEADVRSSIFTVDINLRLPDRRIGVLDPDHGRRAMASLYRAASYTSLPGADAPAPLKRLWLPDR